MMNIPSSEMIMRWLQQARIEHYVCDQCRLNMQYPSLKVFLDIIDDNLPRLIVGHTVFTRAGLSVEQFLLFVESTTSATHEVLAECERLGFLNLPEIQVAPESVH